MTWCIMMVTDLSINKYTQFVIQCYRRIDAKTKRKDYARHSNHSDNPRHYDKMPEQYFSKRLNDKERLTQFAELRVAVRSGNTEGLFARYLQHQNKVIQKNAQLNQQEQPQNEGPMLNQEAPQVKQNPEARNIPIA